ncbi:hypothetical protein VE04_00596 [Pseudogymnoascus sp. 24MN13]|nr:hypothetical protein VE04_00596 [Pseudogymnoascus sp. 24MN13]
MKTTTALFVLSALSTATNAVPAPVVDTVYPYTGPDVPIGDWVDPTINGNGKGYQRHVEARAVKPASDNPTNNVNVISLAYLPDGMNVHYQTPFGLGVAPSVKWGTDPSKLDQTATGNSHTYDRTPPCSLVSSVTMCSQWFHEVPIKNLQPGTTYYYQIPAANGTTVSDVEKFTTARAAGQDGEFSVAVLNDMGYTNAAGTLKQMSLAVDDGVAFAWHGGDISYADDWYSGIIPCESSWPLCYNGSSSQFPGGVVDNPDYLEPLPEGEVPTQGSPRGGDMSSLYESNWDLWQQWTNTITTKVPYMVLPGNHEAACAEFDGGNHELSAYLNDNQANSTGNSTNYLTYYSCPESQRNFTAYMNRFKMPGDETGGVGNFWYSFDYGLAHFVSIDGETDYAYSPEWPFVRDLKNGESHPLETETYPTDSGPFGRIDGTWQDNTGYEQYQWLAKDLASVNRTKTPWVIAMSHRPMWSSSTSSYQTYIRAAFQNLMLQNGVDAYLSGHIHYYERMYPLTSTGAVDSGSVIDQNTYRTNPGVSMTHIINGMAGNIESHSILSGKIQPKTAVLDMTHYGFNKLTFFNATAMKFSFVLGKDGSIADEVTLLKPKAGVSSTSTSASATATTSGLTTLTSGTSTKTCILRTSSTTIGSASTSGTSSPTTVDSSATDTSSPTTVDSSATDTSSPTTVDSSATDTSSPTTVDSSATETSSPTTVDSSASETSSGATDTASSYTSSTVYTTVTSIISSCKPTVINCPYTTAPITVTDTIVDYTTYCPVSGSSTGTAVQTTHTQAASSDVPYTTSTVYKTTTSTISSCASTVVDCPYTTAPIVATVVVVDYTTYCPVATASATTPEGGVVAVPVGTASATTPEGSVEAVPVVGGSATTPEGTVAPVVGGSATTPEGTVETVPAAGSEATGEATIVTGAETGVPAGPEAVATPVSSNGAAAASVAPVTNTTTTVGTVPVPGAATRVGTASFAGAAGLVALAAYFL